MSPIVLDAIPKVYYLATITVYMTKLRAYFSPFFLIRHYIKRDLIKLNSENNICGAMLDVGCGQKPYRALFSKIEKYDGIDFKTYSVNKDFSAAQPDYFFDDAYYTTGVLPFENATYDNTCAFQVLEHHPNPALLLSELTRVTKPGGYIILSFPLLGGLHELPNDYQRYTENGFRKLAESISNLRVVSVIPQGNFPASLITIINEQLNNTASKNKLAYIISVALFSVMVPIQMIVYLLDSILTPKHIFVNYLVLCKKNKN